MSISGKKLQKLVDASSDLVFVPSPPQRKAKAALLIALQDDPCYSLESLNLTQALQVTNDSRYEKWWKEDGFERWLKSKNEFRSRLEYLCQLGLDTAEEVLASDDPKSVNAKVSLIKVLLEAGGKLTRQREVKLLDEAINKMNKHELENYLQKVRLLKPDGGENDGKKESEETEEDAQRSSDTG